MTATELLTLRESAPYRAGDVVYLTDGRRVGVGQPDPIPGFWRYAAWVIGSGQKVELRIPR